MGAPEEHRNPVDSLSFAREAMFACAYDLDPDFGTYPHRNLRPSVQRPDEYEGMRTYDFYTVCEQAQQDMDSIFLGARVGMVESWSFHENATALKPLFANDLFTSVLLDKLKSDIQVTVRWIYEVSHNPGMVRASELIVSDNRIVPLLARMNMLDPTGTPQEPRMRELTTPRSINLGARSERRKLGRLDDSIDVDRINEMLTFLGWVQYRIPSQG